MSIYLISWLGLVLRLPRKDELLTDVQREETVVNSKEVLGKSSNVKDPSSAFQGKTKDRTKIKNSRKGKRSSQEAAATDTTTDTEDSTSDTETHSEGTNEETDTDAPGTREGSEEKTARTNKTTLSAHPIRIKFTQFRNLVLESWSTTGGISGRFCQCLNKKLIRLGLEPLSFQSPWNDVECKEIFPNDEMTILGLFDKIPQLPGTEEDPYPNSPRTKPLTRSQKRKP